MAPEYHDPAAPPDQVRVDSWESHAADRHWYNPLSWFDSTHVVEKRTFNRFADEEVPTQAKRRKVETLTGATREASKDGKCWTEEQIDVFVYVTPHFIRKRWIEYWQVNETLEEYYAFVRDVGQNAEDLAGDAKTVAQSAGLKASSTGTAAPSPGGIVATVTAGTAIGAPIVAAQAATVAEGFAIGSAGATGAGAVLGEGIAVGASAVSGLAGGAGVLASGVVTVTGQVLVPAIAIAGTAVVSFVGTTRLMEKKVKSSQKISEGWELVGPFDGPEAFESSVGMWRQLGAIRDCPGTPEQHWTTPQPEHWTSPLPQPRTGFDLGRWWIWFLGFLLALIVLVTGVALAQRGGNVTAGVPTTAMPSLLAHLVAPSTIYAVEFPGGAPADETYQWIGAIGCGTFSPFSKTPTTLRPGGSTATWTHPNAPLPPPDLSRTDADGDGVFDFCPHSEVPNFSHPGTITVVMSDGKGGDAYCTYQGSLEGTGQCHLGKP